MRTAYAQTDVRSDNITSHRIVTNASNQPKRHFRKSETCFLKGLTFKFIYKL